MGSGCSSQRTGSRRQRRGSSLLRRRCSTTRSRSLSSVLGRFCGGGDDFFSQEQVRYDTPQNEYVPANLMSNSSPRFECPYRMVDRPRMRVRQLQLGAL